MGAMIFNRADALHRMDALKSILVKLPNSAGKQLLMSTMEDYRLELLNDMQERETQQKRTAAHLLKDLQNNEAERHNARERKKTAWGRITLNGVRYSKWELTADWLTMTNDLFFEKYGFNWTPSIALQNDVLDFFQKYGNISRDDLKKPYGAIGETKAPLPGDSCMTKPLTQETVNKFMADITEAYKWTEEKTEMKYTEEIEGDRLLEIVATDEFVNKRAAQQLLTQNQLNILGGQRTPGYKMTK